jgi:hypothetical protein
MARTLNHDLRAAVDMLIAVASDLHGTWADDSRHPELAAIVERLADAVDDLNAYLITGEENGWDEEVTA